MTPTVSSNALYGEILVNATTFLVGLAILTSITSYLGSLPLARCVPPAKSVCLSNLEYLLA